MIPVSANGTVSGPQAAVCALAPAGIVMALDGDDAGRAGTERWLDALTLERHRLPKVAALPDRVDPADWLAERGSGGLAAFGANAGADDAAGARPRMPGRELVRACLPRARNPIRDTAHDILAAAKAHPRPRRPPTPPAGRGRDDQTGLEPARHLRALPAQPVQDLRDRLSTSPSPACLPHRRSPPSPADRTRRRGAERPAHPSRSLMTATPTATTLVAEAATHLRQAAAATREIDGEDAFSIWASFAGQLDLAAAGLDPMWLGHDEPDSASIRDHLAAAAAIDRIAPLEGPPDGHVGLAPQRAQRIAEQMGAP